MNALAPHGVPCGCQGARTSGEETLAERIGRDLRQTTVAEWLQIALAAGALFLSYNIFLEVRKR